MDDGCFDVTKIVLPFCRAAVIQKLQHRSTPVPQHS